MFLTFVETKEKEKYLLVCLEVDGKKNERKIIKKLFYYFIPINYKLIFNYENIKVISQNIFKTFMCIRVILWIWRE